MKILSTFLALFGVLFLPFITAAQTAPAAQSIPFTFSSSPSDTSLPAGIAVHRFSAIPTTRTLSPGTGDLFYASTSAAGGRRNDTTNGISILASGTNPAGALIVSVNTTGKSGIQVQWTIRTILQQASRDNSIALQYRVGNTGNFIDVGTTSTYLSAGKVNGDFSSFSETLPASADNQSMVQIRWVYWESAGTAGSRDRLAVDDISVTTSSCSSPTNQPAALNLTPGIVNINGSFTAAAAGTIPASAYLVMLSTSAALGAQPVNGTAYSNDDIIGAGTVLSNNNATSFSVNSLSPGTTYYFTVYAYNNTEYCYNLVSPLSGSATTLSPTVCTPPSVAASSLTASAITGTSIDLSYVRGNGSNILIVTNAVNPVDSTPVNGVNYTTGSQIGNGNTVIYNGTANAFSYTGLMQNKTYYFALYEYNNATFCYAASLTGSFTTSCTSPINVGAFNTNSGNAQVGLSWINPSGICFNETIIVASDAPISGGGGAYTGSANPVYSGSGPRVVYRGTGSAVTVTGLTNGTNYYFTAFTRIGSNYSSGVTLTAVPYDAATGLLYLAGNIHAHSSYSDGNKDNTNLTPKDDYEFARDALCMDFLGISEHNHSDAGMHLPNFAPGYAQANQVNGVAGGTTGNSIVTLWGMEWGVISGGGHVVVYGFDDQLIGWESGNYNIFCAKNDYNSLFDLVNARSGAFATLAHPNNSDYGNLITSLKTNADNAVVGTAIESGPAFSTNISYGDYPASLDYLSYYKNLLAKGYHVGAQMDHDNHYLTFGRTSPNRMMVMAAAKTRSELVNAIRQMRFYATEDCNARIDYKLNSNLMGSSVTGSALPSISLTVSDPDVEAVSTIQLWGGAIGAAVPSSPLKTYSNVSTVNFTSADAQNTQAIGSTWYYYFIITQADGNKIISSPIWYTRQNAALPVTLIDFTANYITASRAVQLRWITANEQSSRYFIVQRSTDDGKTFQDISTTEGAQNATSRRTYSSADMQPKNGLNFYRLKMVDMSGAETFSKTVAINVNAPGLTHYTIYPNPAEKVVFIGTDNSTVSPLNVTIINTSGTVIYSQKGLASVGMPMQLNIALLPAGVYFLRIVGMDGSSMVKRLSVL